jgi:polyhydroxyalkanoate synthesis regulator phasin
MISLLQTISLYIVRQLYYVSLYIVNYPHKKSDQDLINEDIIERLCDTEESLKTFKQSIIRDIIKEIQPRKEYVEYNTFSTHIFTLNDKLSILQKDIVTVTDKLNELQKSIDDLENSNFM